MVAPNGTRIEFVDANPPLSVPRADPSIVVTKAGADPGVGRAGMLYRDLIPGRQGSVVVFISHEIIV